MKRKKISVLTKGINKEEFDSLFDQLNDNMTDTMYSKVRRGELQKWRRLKHQLI